jgi:hypothetical protein
MPRVVITLALVVVTVAVAWGVTRPRPTLAGCVDSWNASPRHGEIAPKPGGVKTRVRVTRFDSGECALALNEGGVVGGMVESDRGWEAYAGEPETVEQAVATVRRMQRLGGPIVAEAHEDANVTLRGDGTLRPIAGKRIGSLGISY